MPPCPEDVAKPTRGKYHRTIETFGVHDINVIADPGEPNENAHSVSLVCNRHLDSVHHRKAGAKLIPCRQNATIKRKDDGTSDLDQLVLQFKRWAIEGYRFKCECPEMDAGDISADIPAGPTCVARMKHMDIRARLLTKNPPGRVLDALIEEGHFTADALRCLRD